MPVYTLSALDNLEEEAENSKSTHQMPALALVSKILEREGIIYGVMGGMNFYLRGSRRETGDVDIAVDNSRRMGALLNIFNDHQDIYRPANPMQWVGGVARLFVRIQGKYPGLVQVDLKPKGSEGNLIPLDLARSVENIAVSSSVVCKGLAIGPLVAAKIKAHHGRETKDDYHDLRFVCLSATYAPKVRQAASTFRPEWKLCFLEKIREKDPKYEKQVRQALGM